MAAANVPKQQVFNRVTMAADRVLRKALASKFANDWLFRYNSDGIVVCQCKRCPPNNRAELGVANMSQLAARHKCKLEGAPSISRKRSPEPSFGPLPREDRGAAMPEGIQRAVRRRIGLFLVTKQLPFNIMDNVHLQSVFQLLEKHYRTQLLDELYSEVKQATFKELRQLAKDGFVLVSDGWKNKFAGRGSPLINFLVLKPYGGMLFLRVVDVSGKRKDAGAIKELHMDLGLASVECHGVIMDNTAANHSAMRMMQREMPTIVILGCSAHQMNLLCKDLSKPTKEADHQAAAPFARPVMEDHQNFSVAEVLGGVQSVALVISDSEAIRSELKAQQANHSAYSVRPNNPTRFAGLLLMAEDVEKLMPAIHGMVHGDNWPQLRLSSANAAVFEKCVTSESYITCRVDSVLNNVQAKTWNKNIAAPWYKSLKLVIKLMKPISNAIHRLEADAPYLSQVLMVWNALVDHAKEWVEHAVIVSPRLALGVVAVFQRRAAERNWSSWGNTYNAGRSQLNVATAEKMVFIKANIPSSEPSEPSQLLAEGITI